MSDWDWRKLDDKGIARFVLDNATEWLTNPRLAINWNDMHGSVEDRAALVKALYETLCAYPIRYTPEKYQPDQAVQTVRRPGEILDQPGEGTCLDLSLLFCGICIGCELIPLLVRVKGHAFVMVSLAHRLRDWRKLDRSEWKEFSGGPISDPVKDLLKLKGWIDGGRYVAVECTGFARGKVLGTGPEAANRGADDLLAYEHAISAGRAQFDVPTRPLEYAIDLAVARYEWKFPADRLRPPRRSAASASTATAPLTLPAGSTREIDDLPYLTDRVRQKEAVLDTLDRAIESHSGRPAVFLIEGGQEQGHLGLVRRLVRFDLPEWLRLRMSEPCMLDVQITLPSRDSADFDKSLRREIGSKLTLRGDGNPCWEEIAARLGDRPGRVLFKLTFNTSHWLEDGAARLDRLLLSWERCKDLDPARAPIVCVQVVYEPPPPVPWMKRLLGGRNANDALRDHLGRLEGELRGATKYPGVLAVRLAPLADVTPGDLRTWQDLEPVRAFSNGADFTTQIDELFRDLGAGVGLPMNQILRPVRSWLSPYSRGV
jgi:hypothetical protein